MALVNSSFTVNVTPGAMPPTVHVSEYDIGRTYTVTINGQNGSAFNIPSGTTATVEGTLNGAIGFTTSATISGSTVSFTLTESMTAKSGKAWCKIKLTLNDEPIQTCAFILDVDRAGVEAETVIGADGFDTQIQNAVDNYLGDYDFTESTETAVDNWLTAHPEATTTVLDGSLTEQKFSDALKLKTVNDYVTPEMFGAKGDGVEDDSEALQAAIDSGMPVYLPAGTYNAETPLFISGVAKLELANGATIKAVGGSKPYLIGLRNDGKSYQLAENEYIKGGVIDGNGLCDVVIGVNYSHGMIEHCIVKGVKHYGIYNIHNTVNPNVGSGNLMVFHSRILGDPTVTGTIGFGQGGGDCILICTTAQDVETGFQVGSDKLSDCHAWLSRNDIFDNSTAFEVTDSGGQLVNCVSDTMRYGIKSALNYAKFTVSNFSYYFNAGVTPASFLNNHQPIVFNLTGNYPLAVFTNIDVNLETCSGKIASDKLVASTTAKFVCLSLNGMDNAVSANTPVDVAEMDFSTVVRFLTTNENLTKAKIDAQLTTNLMGGYINYDSTYTGWGIVITIQPNDKTSVQTMCIVGKGAVTRRFVDGSWNTFS